MMPQSAGPPLYRRREILPPQSGATAAAALEVGIGEPVAEERAAAIPPDRRDEERRSGRVAARDYYRTAARQRSAPTPDQKYHVDPRDYPPDCDCVWVPIRIHGMDSGQLRQHLEAGWVPARACDFPQHSGYGVEYPEAVQRGGYVTRVEADAVVERDGQMLFVRPQELSDRAERNRVQEAREQVDLIMERLRRSSYLPEGKGQGRTQVQYGQHYVNPDNLDVARGEV